jgi:hypothetical protein
LAVALTSRRIAGHVAFGMSGHQCVDSRHFLEELILLALTAAGIASSIGSEWDRDRVWPALHELLDEPRAHRAAAPRCPDQGRD